MNEQTACEAGGDGHGGERCIQRNRESCSIPSPHSCAVSDQGACLLGHCLSQTKPRKPPALLPGQGAQRALAAWLWPPVLSRGRGWCRVRAPGLHKFKPSLCCSSVLVASSKLVNVAHCMISSLCPPPTPAPHQAPPPPVSKTGEENPFFLLNVLMIQVFINCGYSCTRHVC